MTDVDVVILTWNDGVLVDEAVRSALDSRRVDLRVIVVDNGSDEPAGPFDDERVTLVRSERNLGVAGGRNVGVRQGSAPLVCLLDSDARLGPDALRALMAPLAEDPSVGLSVPVFDGQDASASAGRAPGLTNKAARVFGFTEQYRGDLEAGDEQVWEVDFGIGACQLFRRVAFESVDGIDETYFYGPEDVDFCLRLKLRGWRVVQVRSASVFHPPRRRYRKLATRKGLEHAIAVCRYLWRHRRTPRLSG